MSVDAPGAELSLPTLHGFVHAENGMVVLEHDISDLSRITINDGKLYLVGSPAEALDLARALKGVATRLDPALAADRGKRGSAAAGEADRRSAEEAEDIADDVSQQRNLQGDD